MLSTNTKNTISTWKKNQEKIMQSYHGVCIAKLIKPEIYKLGNKVSFKTISREAKPVTDK